MKNLTSILLVAACLLLVNLLARQFFFRLDLTQNKQYTLSKATKNILKELDEPIMVTGYFTGDLPQDYLKNREDFQNLLIEYSSRSGGMVDYEFIDPNENEENEQQAMQNGISPLLINVREKDAVAQKKAFMGAVISSGDRTDIIPFVQPEGPMEYQVTTAIKKVGTIDKPSVGLIQGHGEPSMQDMAQTIQTLSILYNVEPVALGTIAEIPAHIKTLMMVKPLDSIPPNQLMIINDYLAKGGNLCLAIDQVTGDFQTVQGTVSPVGLDNWLSQKGITIEPSFVIDASAGSISVQQQQGFFKFNSQVQFPYFPAVTEFGDHPITKGIEQVMFQFVSPIQFAGDTTSSFTPIVKTSSKSGIQTAPVQFDVQRQWSAQDLPYNGQTIGALVDNGISKMVIFSDGDFPIAPQSRGQNPDNISLFVNAVDFLSDDTGLIDLRTKSVVTRPIKELEEAEKTTMKWVNFLLPIALVVLYGIFRFQRNRSRRMKFMEEQYI